MDESKDEGFNKMWDTVNMRRVAASWVSHMSDISQSATQACLFKDILVDKGEIPLNVDKACKVQFAKAGERSLTSCSPRK